jgi:coenzyme PQQ precursor peptide PqqA
VEIEIEFIPLNLREFTGWRGTSFVAFTSERVHTPTSGVCLGRNALRLFLRLDGAPMHFARSLSMEWKKPEFTVVAVTMEVTAYAATK